MTTKGVRTGIANETSALVLQEAVVAHVIGPDWHAERGDYFNLRPPNQPGHASVETCRGSCGTATEGEKSNAGNEAQCSDYVGHPCSPVERVPERICQGCSTLWNAEEIEEAIEA